MYAKIVLPQVIYPGPCVNAASTVTAAIIPSKSDKKAAARFTPGSLTQHTSALNLGAESSWTCELTVGDIQPGYECDATNGQGTVTTVGSGVSSDFPPSCSSTICESGDPLDNNTSENN